MGGWGGVEAVGGGGLTCVVLIDWCILPFSSELP